MIGVKRPKDRLSSLLLMLCFSLLVVWVVYEMSASLMDRLQARLNAAETMSRMVEGVIRGGMRNGELNPARAEMALREAVSGGDLIHVRLEGTDGTVLSLGDKADSSLLPSATPEGFVLRNSRFVYWRGILLENGGGRHRLVLVSRAPPRFGLLAKHLMMAVILGITVVFAVFAFNMARNKNSENLDLRRQLDMAEIRGHGYEELSLAAAGLAHETKNPLGVIRGLAQRIANCKDIPKATAAMAREVVEQADVTTARLGDFMKYARMRARRMEDVSAPALINRAAELLAADAEAGQVEIKVETDPLIIRADAEMLSQILLNLLMNGLKFTPPGGIIRVVLRAGHDDTATLTIEDNGHGIDAESLPRIFEPYFSGGGDGYGIGLAIVKRMAEKMDWHIKVESEPGAGARFTIENIKQAA